MNLWLEDFQTIVSVDPATGGEIERYEEHRSTEVAADLAAVATAQGDGAASRSVSASGQ